MLQYITLFLLLFRIALPLSVVAQDKNTPTGQVKDKHSGQTLEFVNVIVKKAQDNLVLMHEVTNITGKFNFSKLPDGKYFLQFSYIGYDDFKTGVFEMNQGKPVPFFDIGLNPTNSLLNEIQVSAKQAILTNSIDRKVYHVDQDIMAKSGSASEVLQNVPLVQVDIDGNISLRNSTVTILIDGKISPLMGKNAAAALQQLPANSIERIELITNPSAKYKPDGMGGIINIVLKKNTKRGLNGSVTANAGTGERYNSSANFNYNPGKVNVFGSYSVKQDGRIRTTTNQREQTDATTNQIAHYLDAITSRSRPFSNIAALGFTYNPDQKNSLGLSGNFYSRNMNKNDLNVKQVTGLSSGNLDYDRHRKNTETEKNANATLFFEHSFLKPAHKFRIEYNMAHSPEIENNHYTNSYRLPQIPDQMDNTLIRQTADTKNLTLSYENPLTKNSKLEAGYDGQYNKQDLDFYGEAFQQSSQQFVKDNSKTNRFIYHENVHAFYGTWSQELNKIDIMIGLRAEYSDLVSRLMTTNSSIPNHYLKFYPTLHFTYRIADNRSFQFNYSRRVRRPEADDLNPFAEYADPSNIKVGNPYLKPEIIHSIEAGYLVKTGGLSIIPGIYYKYTYNRFTAITEALNDSVLVTRQQNLSNDQALGADVVLSGSISSKLNLSFTPNVYYNQIDASNLGYGTKKSTITWSANFNTGYALTNTLSFQLNSIYKSARLTPQGKYLPSFVLNLAARKDILNKKGAVYITASDVFKTLRQQANLNSPLLIQHILTKSNSQMAYLGFSYNFGSVKKKKDLQFDNSL